VALQAPTWTAAPTAPTVGDTVVLERLVPTETGAVGRTRQLDASEQLEPLTPPEIRSAAGGLMVRHAVALFAPGLHRIAMPAIEVLHADGTVEVIMGDTADVEVAAVIPDTIAQPAPKPSLGPIARPVRDARRVAVPVVVVLILLAAWLSVRRRTRPVVVPPASPPAPVELPLMRWLAAGEWRAVAALAVQRLRDGVAASAPEAAAAGDPEAWAGAVTQAHPEWPVGELADVMRALERARFAPLAADDLVELVDRTDVVLGRLRDPEAPTP